MGAALQGRTNSAICWPPSQSFLEGDNKYLAGAEPSIADLSLYMEVSQVDYCGFFSLSKFPNVLRWLASVRGIDGHDRIMNMKGVQQSFEFCRERQNTVPGEVSSGSKL